MKIDKKYLDRSIWYEDANNNIIDFGDRVPSAEELKQYNGLTYHACFPLQITEQIYTVEFEDDDYKLNHLIDCNTHIGGGNQEVIMAMVNSGDYTLNQALRLCSESCERCMNVLAYKYLDGKDGYPEFSGEWRKCNTVCKFCKDEDKQ